MQRLAWLLVFLGLSAGAPSHAGMMVLDGAALIGEHKDLAMLAAGHKLSKPAEGRTYPGNSG